MPYPNEHSARIEDPSNFKKDSFRTKEIAPGVTIIIAKRTGDKNGSMITQAYRFDKTKFTVKQAKDWLKKYKVKYIMFEPAKEEESIMKNDMLSEQRIEGSFEKLRDDLTIIAKNSGKFGKYPWIVATFPKYFIIKDDEFEKTYRVDWTLTDGQYVLGDVVQVTEKTQYVKVESLGQVRDLVKQQVLKELRI
ncbi:MAG: hypothetical protein AB1401_00450 [Thermodesulfobacteriota bacterium]